MDNNIYWQLVGYTGGNTWMNRQVSYWTGADVNHVGIRFYGTEAGHPVDLYHGIISGPEEVRSGVLSRIYTPVYESSLRLSFAAGYREARNLASNYPSGKPALVYTHHFLGLPRTPPPTCTRMTSEILEMFGYPVSAKFLPGKLISEFNERYEECK